MRSWKFQGLTPFYLAGGECSKDVTGYNLQGFQSQDFEQPKNTQYYKVKCSGTISPQDELGGIYKSEKIDTSQCYVMIE